MNILLFFRICKQRNEKEETQAAYRGDGKTIFRERNGYEGNKVIYKQGSARTCEYKFFSLWSCMYLSYFLSYCILHYRRPSLVL